MIAAISIGGVGMGGGSVLCGVAIRAIVACGFLGSGLAHALDPERPLAEFSLKTWTRDDGLPHNFVMDVIQSPDGYIWAATWLGAVRFNGREFVVHDQQRLPWVRDGSAVAFVNGDDGSFLVASQRYGISRQYRGKWSPHPVLPSSDTMVFALAKDIGGRLWIGTDTGLLRVDGDDVRRFGSREGLPEPSVSWMHAASDGSMWVGTTRGAARVTDEAIKTFGIEQGLPAGEIGAIFVQADGLVRVGSKDGAYALREGRFVREPAGLPEDEVTTLLQDKAGSLWVGTAGNGLFRVTARGIDRLHARNGLPADHIDALIEDDQGNLWIGTHGGLVKLTETDFAGYTRDKGLADDFVRSMALHPDGSLWVATNAGLSRIVHGRAESLAPLDARAGLPALSLLPRSDGQMWVGTYSHGITVVDGGRWQVLGRDQGIEGEEIRAMLEARDGSIWIGSTTAVTRWREGQPPQNWTGVGEMAQAPFVRSLLQDSRGRVWIGLQPGLAWSDGETLHAFEEVRRAGHGAFGLHECRHGAVWIAGQGGLRRWREGKLEALPAQHGLADMTVFAFLSDGKGTDWLTTTRGLISVNHDELEAAMDGRAEPLRLRRAGESNSNDPLALNGGSMPSALFAPDGRLWLATSQGLFVHDPGRAAPAQHLPPVAIESIERDGEAIEPEAMLQLPPGTRRVEFRYAGLSFSAPDSVSYRYRLDGYDPGWVDAGSTTLASYTNLTPGDYTFRVQALLEGAIGAPREARQNLRLLPHLYQTATFRVVLGVVLLFLLALGYRIRVGELRRRAARLQLLVDERTHDLHERSLRLEAADHEKAGLIERLREQSIILERYANEDGLTGLFNRRHVDSKLEAALREAREAERTVRVALIDIDHFKAVNDHHGHAVGDEVLRRLAALIRARCGPERFAGRYGGEEFVVVFCRAAVDGADDWCETLREAAERMDLSEVAPGLRVTLSIGVSDATATDPRALYAAADSRLYAAKRGGRNRVIGAGSPVST